MKQYILGVDGGNSKTDYLLCTTEGEFIDIYRQSTCSHENFHNGYEGMYHAMKNHVEALFLRNNISMENISVAVFGLAGADTDAQIVELEKQIIKIGFSKFVVSNDGLLGVKAISDKGFGICAINGTGMVVIGMDDEGQILQVGGIGSISGDLAGGGTITRQAITATYSHYFRCGEYSEIIPKILDILHVKDIKDLFLAISDYNLLIDNIKNIMVEIDIAALNGDKLAKNLLDSAGENIGKSVAGCILNSNYHNEITVVLAGNTWIKIKYPGLISVFKETVLNLSKRDCKFILLESPPVIGAIFWALEIYKGGIVSKTYKKEFLSFLTTEKYEKLCNESAK